MAPEMFHDQGPQTTKVDVWSLFATTMSVTGRAGFHERLASYHEGFKLIQAGASEMKDLSSMARVDPNLRASAAQMLMKIFEGEGLSTPRHQVRKIPNLDGQAEYCLCKQPPKEAERPSVPSNPHPNPSPTHYQVQKVDVRKKQARNEGRLAGALRQFT